jgi:hypothetical protein
LGHSILAILLIIYAVLAYQIIRINETSVFPKRNLKRSFVIRRATVAKNIFDSISIRRSDNPSSLHLVYGKPNAGKLFIFSRDHIMTALGKGSGFRLLYHSQDLKIKFHPWEDAARFNPENADIFYYGDLGYCYTPSEMKARVNQR